MWYNWPENLSNSVKKRKIRAITAFKAIQGHRGRYQSKAHMRFLLVINSNWHPISYRFGVIAAYCSNFAPTRPLTQNFIFAPIVRPMNALQLCPWQFSHSCYGWGATSENRSKIGDVAPTRLLWSKISGRRDRPPRIIFARLVRPMNALQLCRWQFSHKETL